MVNKVVIVLNESELIRLRRIITDEDAPEALAFLAEILKRKVDEKTASYGSLKDELELCNQESSAGWVSTRRVPVSLGSRDLYTLSKIVETGDKEMALKFALDTLEDRLKAAELPHCVPVFEAGYHPGQADMYRKR